MPFGKRNEFGERNKGTTLLVMIHQRRLPFKYIVLSFNVRKISNSLEDKELNSVYVILNVSASWGSMAEESGEAPKLSGAKAFTYDEIKMYTNNFQKINVIGVGGYGEVNPI